MLNLESDFAFRVLEWGCPRDKKSRPVAVPLPFEETTSEKDFCGPTQKQRKITGTTAVQTTSEILHVK